MQVREKKHDHDMLPMVMKENKPVTEFEPDFFIVSLAHGQPKKKRDYNILKLYDFPAENRLETINVRFDLSLEIGPDYILDAAQNGQAELETIR